MGLVQSLAHTDIFKRNLQSAEWETGLFVGRPFRLTYSTAELLMTDAWKERAKGIPQGCFLLAYYDNAPSENSSREAVLLRVLRPAKLPTDQDVIASMVEYYKDNVQTGDKNPQSQLDTYTRYEFSFSGLECSVLGSFYLQGNQVRFGADLENFFSAHNYSIIKPNDEVLSAIVNYRENGVPGGPGDIRIGKVRYSSSRRFQQDQPDVLVYVRAPDFAGKRTALFGMTRTGKPNTVKKIIQACVEMSDQAPFKLQATKEQPDEIVNPFTGDSHPKYPIGQIIFDINGEYANRNLQDSGTAIFDMYADRTERYSTVEKPDFKVLRVNFYNELENGFELIRAHPRIADDSTRFVSNFRSVDLSKPDGYGKQGYESETTRYDRQVSL